MDFNFKSVEELYARLLPALKTKKNEMKTLKMLISEIDIWHYFCENVWNKKNGLTIGEMVDDILNTDSIDIYLKKGKPNENKDNRK